METQQLNVIFQKVFLEVFEQHAFFILDPVNSEQTADESVFKQNEYYKIEMSVRGDLNGIFILLLPLDICKEIEENLTGSSDDSMNTDEFDGDGAKELLNMMGAVITETAYGEDVVFDISIPFFSAFDDAQWSYLSQLSIQARFMANEHFLFLFFDKRDDLQ